MTQKILVVDDLIAVQELLKETLKVYDYTILGTTDGDEAIEIAKTQSPDLILLDVKMPQSRLSGIDVCYRLKKNPLTQDITIIILSAQGQQGDIEAGLLAGADDYITKPFSPTILVEKIQSYLA